MEDKLLSVISTICLIASLLCGCSVDMELPTDSHTESESAESVNQEIETSEIEESKSSATEESYNIAISLTKSSLKKSNHYKTC